VPVVPDLGCREVLACVRVGWFGTVATALLHGVSWFVTSPPDYGPTPATPPGPAPSSNPPNDFAEALG